MGYEIIAGRAVDRPGPRNPLVPGENLLHQEIERRGIVGAVQPLDAPQIILGLAQPVDVIDAQARDVSVRQQSAEQGMAGAEDLGLFHPQAHQSVDGKEPAVVDLMGASLPAGQPVMLLLDQAMELVKAPGVARLTVQPVQKGGQALLQRGIGRHERRRVAP